jgi:hypothetical protein
MGEKAVQEVDVDMEIAVRQPLPHLRGSGSMKGKQAAARTERAVGDLGEGKRKGAGCRK